MADDAIAVQDDEDLDKEPVPQPEQEEKAIVPRETPAIQPIARPETPAIVPAPNMASPQVARTALNTVMAGTAPATPINPAVAPAPPSGAAAAGNAVRQNPFAALMANEPAIHSPVARVLHKLAQLSPEVRQEEEKQREFNADEPLKEAQTEDVKSQTKLREAEAASKANPPAKIPKPIGEPVRFNDGWYIPVQDESAGGVSFAPMTGGPAGPAGGPARMPNAANGTGSGAQTPGGAAQTTDYGVKLGTKPEKEPETKPGEFKTYSVDGKEVLGQQVGNKIIDAQGNDITAKALPFEKPEKEPALPKQLVMVPQPDGTTKVIEAVPGTVLPKGATTLANANKEESGTDAKAAAQQYADDYMASKKFTGAGDEALMDKYFELAKPGSGFRMSQAQIEMLQKARDLMGGLKAWLKHALTPEAPYFSDIQRQQIVDTMGNLSKAADESKTGSKAGSATVKPKSFKDWKARQGQ